MQLRSKEANTYYAFISIRPYATAGNNFRLHPWGAYSVEGMARYEPVDSLCSAMLFNKWNVDIRLIHYVAVFFKHLCAYESSGDLVKNAH